MLDENKIPKPQQEKNPLEKTAIIKLTKRPVINSAGSNEVVKAIHTNITIMNV